ncbi:hypothetical protein B0T19DRAFT_480594 [Cercophora scortea]|uniref:Uncharacterized protein n=1 Tax=Cercophora scortea TaxID=314031 RepID=A0AAE0MLD4_9PEZI|nr:hypothetical protein B0T19DRAFT_480594 [Cercophora scortea]
MPPNLPRSSLCGVRTALSSRVATTSAPAWRTASVSPFSTTAPASQTVIPPESPKFIRVPEPPQSSEVRLPPIRGHLPVPRQIFPKREGNKKVKPGYIESVAPLSAAELAGLPPKTEHEARHRRMAESRRQSLAAGLQGLYVRKTQQDSRVNTQRNARLEANKAAAMAPEGPDDLLTRSTLRASTAEVTTVQLDPARLAAAEVARAHHAAIDQLKSEQRRDALSQLYVAAGDFIVDEAELEDRVNKIFVERYHNTGASDGDDGSSIWNMQDSPIGVSGLRARATGRTNNAISTQTAAATVTTTRQRTVAEVLTGGKLE